MVGAGTATGKALVALLRQQGIAHHSFNERQLDDADLEVATLNLARLRPDQVIHVAGFRGNSQFSHLLAERAPEACEMATRRRTDALVRLCTQLDLPLIYLSNPYVFDGEKKLGYNENDGTGPRGVLGQSVVWAEQAVAGLERHLILRAGWLFGNGCNDQIRLWLRTAKKQHGRLSVARRRLSPTPLEDLARVLLAVTQQLDCDAPVWGTYHYCGLETKKEIELVGHVFKYASQHDEQVYQLLDSLEVTEVDPVAADIANATLSTKKLFDTFGIKQRSWHGSLQSTIKALYQQGAQWRAGSESPALPDTSLMDAEG